MIIIQKPPGYDYICSSSKMTELGNFIAFCYSALCELKYNSVEIQSTYAQQCLHGFDGFERFNCYSKFLCDKETFLSMKLSEAVANKYNCEVGDPSILEGFYYCDLLARGSEYETGIIPIPTNNFEIIRIEELVEQELGLDWSLKGLYDLVKKSGKRNFADNINDNYQNNHSKSVKSLWLARQTKMWQLAIVSHAWRWFVRLSDPKLEASYYSIAIIVENILRLILGTFLCESWLSEEEIKDSHANLTDSLEHMKQIPYLHTEIRNLRNYNMNKKTIKDLDLRDKTGCTIIGYKDEKGNYIVNPEENLVLAPHSKIIVLGRPEQIEVLNLEYDIR